ncbi:MAG: putative metallophosphoesterase [Syntrophorhabdus sp. PtaB.Bin006]|nr:MAG: putative metallophosphoesterase [Syntrophorhabdus sp. PtaB.Bin006]
MSFFLIIFFLVYGAFHLYGFVKVKAAFKPGVLISVCLAAFMIIMVLAPVAIRLSERAGAEGFARFMSYVGYIWMGALLIFVCTNIVIDILRLILHGLAYVLGRDWSSLVSAHKCFLLVSLAVSLLVTAYGYYEAGRIRMERVVIRTDKIPANPGKLRIVQISDVHIGLIVGKERLEKIVEKIRKVGPDILVSSGDLVDGQLDSMEELSGLLRAIDPPLGKFAVTGNHEYYAGLPRAIRFTEKAGFKMLRCESVTIPGAITIVGVDDAMVRNSSQREGVAEIGLLGKGERKVFTLLLKHRPIVNEGSAGFFDLQLSGHTHKGQIFPFGLIARLFFPLFSGYYDLPGGSCLYVSRGAGTWGPPVRFLAPPEVTLIELVQ